MKVEPTEYHNRLDVGCEIKTGIQTIWPELLENSIASNRVGKSADEASLVKAVLGSVSLMGHGIRMLSII